MSAKTDAVERARHIANEVLKGGYDPLLACRELINIREQLSLVPNEVMDVIIAVESEVDGLPIGPERAYWAPESLRVKDLQAADYRAQVRGQVEEALRTLLAATGDDSPS